MTTVAVIAVETTENRKTGPVSVTHVSQASCPRSCPLFDNGCYAEVGPQGFITSRLNDSDVTRSDVIACQEAEAIDGLTGDRPLRLHVVGDCRTPAAARIVSAACERYTRRGGQVAWTYTHAWRDVERTDWGSVSVLASCETTAQAEESSARGYAVALIVPQFAQDGAYDLAGTSLRVIPCPYQTRGVQCRDCRLCWDSERLHREGLCVGFAAHGSRKNSVLEVLEEA
jgi:hypothetical protein